MFHSGPIASVAACGPYIATAGYDNQVILWDISRRQAIARSMHDHLVNHCAFNSVGTLLVSASSDYSARIWEVPSMQLKAALIGHSDDVDMAVFSPDDSLVATCALDRTIRIFDLVGNCLKIFHGHTGNIISLAWSHDGQQLVSSSVDGTVRQWDFLSGNESRCNNIDVRTDTLVIDRYGIIFAGDDKGRIVVIINGRLSYVQAHKAGIKKIAYDEKSRILVTLSYDRMIAIWQVSGEQQVRELSRAEFPSLVWARSAAFIGPAQIAVGTFGSSYGTFDWHAKTWDLSGIIPDAGLNAVTVVGNNQYAIGDAGILIKNGKQSVNLGSLCNFLLAVDNVLLSGGQLGQLFNAKTGEVIYQHHSPLNCGTSFKKNGKTHIIIGSYTGEAIIFLLDNKGVVELVKILKIYENAIKGLVATEEIIFSVCANTTVCWHDITDFKLIRFLPNSHERIANGCCLVEPNGFATISRDRKLRLWIGDKIAIYQTPHPNSVKCICASDDGRILMTGSYTGTIAGFDMESRGWCYFSRPTASGISSLTFDSQNKQFLASSYDGKIYPVALGLCYDKPEFNKAKTSAVSSQLKAEFAPA